MATPKKQVDKFREAARDLECDDSPTRFDARVRKIAKPPPKKAASKPKAR